MLLTKADLRAVFNECRIKQERGKTTKKDKGNRLTGKGRQKQRWWQEPKWMYEQEKIYLQRNRVIETELGREILVRRVFIQLWVRGWPYSADVNGFRVWVYGFETTLTPKLALKICLAYKWHGRMSSFKHPSALVFWTDLSKQWQGATAMWWVGKLADSSLQTSLGHANKPSNVESNVVYNVRVNQPKNCLLRCLCTLNWDSRKHFNTEDKLMVGSSSQVDCTVPLLGQQGVK